MQTDEKLVLETEQKFLEEIRKNHKHLDVKLIKDALDYANDMHGDQKRESGELFILHPIEAASILLELKVDTASIVTAILHDTVEDTLATTQDIKEKFGNKIAELVDGVTKLSKIKYSPKKIEQARNFRKLFIAVAKDIRTLLVKLADRLHNMRTLHHKSNKTKRLECAHETMEIYAPLAERMGIYKIKNELQELAFAEIHSKLRTSLKKNFNNLINKGTRTLKDLEDKLKTILNKYNIKAEIYGREKSLYSIWNKMRRKNISFEQISDIVAFRVIVEDIEACYKALGILHTKYHMVPNTFEDYISTPKINGYQSLHTIIIGPYDRSIEMQIRTKEMHEVAERGVAAHCSYKEGVYSFLEGKEIVWLRKMVEMLNNTATPQEFLDNIKLELYYEQIFCFTPKGDVISLPKSATTVDFAFAVHSELGRKYKSALVNFKEVPPNTKINHGDQVEIIYSDENHLSIDDLYKDVITGKAKVHIRKMLRNI